MKLFGTAIIGGFIVMSSHHVQASPLGMMQKQVKQLQIEALKAPVKVKKFKVKGQDCDDLSGTWVGTCRDSDGTTGDEHLTIEQYGCNQISIGTDFFNLGGFDSQSQSLGDEPAGGNSISFARWDESGKFISLQSSAHYGVNNSDVFIKAFARGKFFLQDNFLHQTLKIKTETEVAGNIKTTEFASECSYSKK